MALLLKRNSTPDPWYSVHSIFIKEDEIVTLVHIENESGRSEMYPPEIFVKKILSEDTREYKASLCCYDYVGSSNGS